MNTTTSTLSDDTVELDLSELYAQPEAPHPTPHPSPRGGLPWRHLGAIGAGAVTFASLALLISAAGDGQPDHERGCFVARYVNPGDYPACSTDPDGNAQSLTLKRH